MKCWDASNGVSMQQSSERNFSPSRQDEKMPPTETTQEHRGITPFCSVLNVVFDHFMVPPSPLEPEEYRESVRKHSLKVRVPLIRVFGPLIRGDALEPMQSACLYIHNAFPYLIARPVLAGPDGSLIRGAHAENLTDSGHVDWDCVTSVERVLPQLKATLEASIQASFPELPVKPPRVIRKLSIMVGRGFYTYCPGPAAPFLKVEYYDPKLRWKVKLMLERGLDVPTSYHPDPHQYQDSLTSPSQPKEMNELLKFHCYEAHIPFSMQFFKDWNLAGMSYIHLSGGFLRQKLPGARRRTFKGQNDEYPREALFLNDNTSHEHIWSAEAEISLDGIASMQQSSNSTQESNRIVSETISAMKIDQFWSRKATSCDVELDVSVDQILNVKDIMTDLPEEEDERQKIHWRAVPSLKEIWKQERRRMSKLLAPTDDFLSPTKSLPPFTLSSKKDAGVPGSRLAVMGMKRLFSISVGLEEEFKRAMRQIIQRHLPAVLRVDNVLRDRQSIESVAKIHLTMTSQSDRDALEALGALADQFGDCRDGHLRLGLSQRSGIYNNLSQVSQSSSTDMPHSSLLSQSQLILDHESEEDAVEFSQRLDRGEGLVDPRFEHFEDYINPKTLTPFDDVELEDDVYDDENEISEQAMEHSLSMLATQTEDRLKRQTDKMKRHDFSHQANDTEEWNRQSSSQDPLVKEAKYSQPMDSLHAAAFDFSQKSDDIEEMCGQWSTSRSPALSRNVKGANDDVLDDSAVLPTQGNIRELLAGNGSFLPPPRKSVIAWCKKNQRREFNKKKNKPEIGENKVNRLTHADLEFDGNSRMLVLVEQDSKKRKVDKAMCDQRRRNKREECSLSEGMIRTRSKLQLNENEKVPVLAPLDNYSSTNLHSDLARYHTDIASMSLSSTNDSLSDSRQVISDALDGIGQQGGRIHIAGGGGLKAKTKGTQNDYHATTQQRSTLPKGRCIAMEMPTPLSIMSIEIHVQCRTGRAGVNDSKQIAMCPNSDKDRISAIVYIFASDPGGGEAIRIMERGCIFLPVEAELSSINHSRLASSMESSIPRSTMGATAPLVVEVAKSERLLLLRIASIVRQKDPDMLVSWDTQGGGVGYMIERGAKLGQGYEEGSLSSSHGRLGCEIDMARLMGRTPNSKNDNEERLREAFIPQQSDSGSNPPLKQESEWKGSGLGTDWDERVGAGAAAASIVGRIVFAGWKLVAEEVKHPNSSYLPAMVSTVLNKRIPFHDDLHLTRWYGIDKGKERWRVLHHRLVQAMACLLLFDALDMAGRAGEAARLSGVEFSQSFPGIRGSQYKVEGVLLRALKSIRSDERGSKRGHQNIPESVKSKDASSSLSNESTSQTQSPWKVRRGINETGVHEEGPIHNVSERNYFFYSPSVHSSSKQEALECQALTLEPQSGCQNDPVVVCDFTALYPSLIIAYNLCYSTCAGKLNYHSTRAEMCQEGRTNGRLGPFEYSETRTATVLKHHIKSLDSSSSTTTPDEKYRRDRAYVVPTGCIYVSEAVLKGVLPQVLDEMLCTRAMLKKAAKQYKKMVPGLSPAILRQLEARQLALKYVANVTYGYTSATFSGRCAMPILADSIVECARRTLTNAINLANKWGKDHESQWHGAEVIYGDTDSLFVRLPGRSVQEAFVFGHSFCEAVTASNPPPVQLKLEKVYCGSMMQTKKKYCGMKYESKEQKDPVFEAKGIETIRKDQCALTQKVLRNALITMFQDGINAVKDYLFRQWTLIHAGDLPVTDFILTGRVRSQYRGGRVGPVQAVLARRLSEADPGRVVRHKERLAYVIVATPGLTFRLRDCVLTPMELLEQWDAYTIHSAYYIAKHVNSALQRCLGLAPHFVDVNLWYTECPVPRKRIHFWPVTRSGSNIMISSYFGSDICSLCGIRCKAHGSARAVVCSDCRLHHVVAAGKAMLRLNKTQKECQAKAIICNSCNGSFENSSTFAPLKAPQGTQSKHESKFSTSMMKPNPGIITPISNCTCIDCPITFERHQLREKELEALAICEALEMS